MIGNTAAQNNFGALRHGAIEVDVLAGVGVGVVQVLDLVAELVVEVHRAQRHAIVEAGLLQSPFHNRVSLRAGEDHNQFRDQIEYLYNSDTNTSQYVNFNRAM